MSTIEIIVFVTATLVLFPFFAFALSTFGVFFTRLESGDIKFIVRGNTLHKIIYDVRGLILEKNQFKPATSPRRPWFGLYLIGFPPFFRVHRFKITKERENPAGTTPESWTENRGEEEVDALYFTFPRPFVLREVELGDRIPVDVLVVAKFEVVNPYIPVFLFKGKFFENAGGIIRAGVSDILKRYTLDDFVKSEKGEVGGMLEEMKNLTGDFNTELTRQVGLRLVGISIPQYDPSDKAIRKAMNAQTIAQEEAKAILVSAEANASAQERLARARGVRIRETVETLALSHGNPDIVARGAADILEMEAATGADSKLTTLVKNGGAVAAVPVGGDRK